jgi:hypothetical protein
MSTQAAPAYADLSAPIKVVLDAQEVGRLYANKTNPYKFRQYLLEMLRQAGAPVSGILDLKLDHGAIARFTKEPVVGQFTYFWIPEEWTIRMKEQQKFEERLTR